MTRFALAFLLLCPLASYGQPAPDPKVPPISFTDPKLPLPPPLPAESPVPLNSGTMYVLYGSVPFQVLDEPQGIVNIDMQAGPMTIYGVFADSAGLTIRRDYKDKYIAVVTPKTKGNTTLIITAGVEYAPVRRHINVGNAPIPPGPGPDPGPAPEPTDPLWPSLKAAYIADGKDATNAAALAKALGAIAIAGTDAAKFPTGAAYHEAITKAEDAAGLTAGSIQKTRGVLSAELNRLLPRKDSQLDDGSRTLIATQFARCAQLLTALKGVK